MATPTELGKKQFLQPLVETINLTLNLPTSIWLIDDDGESLQIAVATGLPDDYMHEVILRLDEPNVGSRVFQTGETTVVKDIASDERWQYKEQAAAVGLKSAIVVPLRADEEIIGVLDVYTYEAREFSDLEKNLIEDLASRVITNAVQSARLFEQTTIRAEILEKIHQIGKRILSAELSTRGLEEVLTQIARSAKDTLGADLVDVYQYIEAEDRYVLPPILEGDRRDPTVVKSKIYEDDVVVKVIEEGNSLYSPDAQAETVLTSAFTVVRPDSPDKRFVVREGIFSSAAIPLKTAGETVGAMFVNYRTRQDFPDEQRDLIELFANQAAIAIYNARVYEQAQRRIKALEALNEVSQELNTVEVTEAGLKNLLKKVAQQAKDILDADLVELYQYSPGREDTVAFHVSLGKRFSDTKPAQVLPDDVVLQIWRRSEPLFAYDAQNDPNLTGPFETTREGKPSQRFVFRERISSTAAVPLIVGDEAVGVLFVNYRTPQKFPVEQQELIQLFANQAAVAIRNAQLFWQREALQDIARDITSALDRDELLQRTLERSLKLLNCEFGSISVFDPATDTLHFQYAVGKSPEMSVKLGEGLIGTAAKARTTVRVADVSKDKRYIEHIGETKSELDVPMLVEDRLVGVLNAESKRLNAFSEEEQRLAEALAAQAAVAFHTAELYEEAQAGLQERVDDIEALKNIYALIGTAPIEEMLKGIAEEAARLTPAKYTGIWLVDERARELRFGARNEREAPTQAWSRLSLDETSISGHVALTGETYLCNDVREDPYYQQWYEDTRSELTTPLIYGNKVIGIINLESTEVGAFTEDHKRLVESLAGAAAVAIQSARLYRQLERRVGALAALNEVGQTLTSGIRLKRDDILELIYEQAKKLTGAQDMYIALYDEETNTIHFGLATEHGERVEYEPRVANMDERGKTEEVIFTQQPILHRTLEESKAWYGRPGHKEFIGRVQSSYLGVPLIAGEEVLGMIALYDWERDHAYDEQDLRTFSSMASQAAIALDNATLYYDVIQRLEALNEIGQKLTSGIRLAENQILELIYEQAGELTGAQDMYIALYDEETNMIRFGLATEHGERVEYEPREADMDERGKTEEVIFTRQPILHRTLKESRAWYGQPGHKEFIGRVASSWLGVPLVAGEKVLGMIALYDWERDHAYDEQDLQTFSSMASQAAIALDNNWLLEAERDQRRLAEALREAGAVVSSTLQLNDVLDRILEQVERIVEGDTFNVMLLGKDESEIIRFRSRGYDRLGVAEPSTLGLQSIDKLPILNKMRKTRNPLVIPDTSTYSNWESLKGREWLRSYAAAPICTDNKVVGFLNVNGTRPGQFGPSDGQRLLTFANYAAIAIKNARLYEQAREDVVATKQLATLGTAIAALQHRINNTFNIIVPNVTRLRKRVDMTDETVVEILDIIERNARYTSDIIARIQEPLREVEIQEVDVNAVLDEVTGRMEEQWSDIVIEKNLNDDLPLVRAPIGQVAEVFSNLCDNACRAMGGNGQLIVASRLASGIINVRVQDTGPGIPLRIQERLFAKPVPSKEPGGGAGLGLWLSQLMLQTIGGKIGIEKTDSTGTTMLVQIPAPGAEGVQL